MKLSALDPAAAFTGAELFPLNQDGDTVLGTLSNIAIFVNASAAAPQLALDDLTDVDMSYTPNSGDVLSWNGSWWEARTAVLSVNGQTGDVGLDLFSGDYTDLTNKPTLFDGVFASLTGKPTSLAGYGITDAAAAAPVQSVFGRTGTVTLLASDVTTALGSTFGFSNGVLTLGVVGGAVGSLTAPASASATAPPVLSVLGGANTSTGLGGDVNIYGGDSAANKGSVVNIKAGSRGGGAGPATNHVNITGGAATAGPTAGRVNITGGTFTGTGGGGGVALIGGSATDGSGGSANLQGGAGTSTTGSGGQAGIAGGASAGSGAGGTVSIAGGNNTSTGAGGDITLIAGTSSGGAAGNVMISKTTAANTTAGTTFLSTGAIESTMAGAGSATQVAFYRNASGTSVGSITTTSTATAYNTSSDARIKENIEDALSASDLVLQMQVRSFDFKDVPHSHVDHGFIAQELAEVVPSAVSPGDFDVEVRHVWSVDYSKLVPVLAKALQEALVRIDVLEAKLRDLTT